MQYIEKVGLTRFASAYPHTLSGGNEAAGRPSARGHGNGARILLMDEPFAALDALHAPQRCRRSCCNSGRDALHRAVRTNSIPEAVLAAIGPPALASIRAG